VRGGSEFGVKVLNGSFADSFGESLDLPDWAEFLDIENDGGRPLRCQVGFAETIIARTGMRIPIATPSNVRITVDTDENAGVSGSLARVIYMSAAVALLVPPPSREPTRVFQQRETVVQAAATQLISVRTGILKASVRFPTLNGTATGQIFIADTATKCTAALGVELLPGDAFEDWVGPLFVFRPAIAANGELDVTQAVKELGAFAS